MSLPNEKAPAGKNEGPTRNSDSAIPSISHSLDLVTLEQQLTGIYVVVAEIKSPGPDPRYRRRFYANLPSAQRAVDRAVMNGKDAHLFIGQISIVGGDPR